LTNGQTNRQTDIQTNRQTNRQTNKQTNRQTDKQTNRQTDKQTNRQTDKQTNRQTTKQTKSLKRLRSPSSLIFLLYFSWPSPSCVEPKDFLNKGPIVTIFGLESKANLESAVDQLATHLAGLNLPTVIVFGPRFNSSGVIEALENSQIKDRVSFHLILCNFTFGSKDEIAFSF
jgi:hypothetical protein